MSEHYDVIVIGGGVAGLSTAGNITEGSVLLLEKDKIKTEMKRYLRFTYMDSVERLGLIKSIIKGYDTLSFRTLTNKTKNIRFHNDVLALVDLGLLNNNLKTHVKKIHTIKEKSKVIDVKQYSDNVEVITNVNGNKKVYNSKYLVDASGINFFTKKKFNLPHPKFFCHCLESTNEGGYKGDSSVLTFVMPSERFKFGICIFPYGTNNYSIGLTDNSKLLHAPQSEYRELIKQTKKNLGFDDLIGEGKISYYQMGIIPLGVSPPLTFGKVCYVGDVLSQVNPWMVEGVRPIIESSVMCANALNAALERQEDVLLDRYVDDWCSTYGAVYNTINLVKKWNRTTEMWIDSFKRMMKLTQTSKEPLLRLLKYDQISEESEERLTKLKSTLSK